LLGEDVGDPVDGGFEPDGITGGGAGNDEFEAMFGVAAEPDEPLARSSGGLLFGTDRVGLDDLGFEQGLQPPPGQRPNDGAIRASTYAAWSALRWWVAAAIHLAW
jgi:hypothetical protein